jgi:hypothetical protein
MYTDLIHRTNIDITAVFILVVDMLHCVSQSLFPKEGARPFCQDWLNHLMQCSPQHVLYPWVWVIQIFLQTKNTARDQDDSGALFLTRSILVLIYHTEINVDYELLYQQSSYLSLHGHSST